MEAEGRKYREHCLAFLYMTGSFPEAEVDHGNSKRDWQPIEQLARRHGFAGCPCERTSRQSNNKSGFKGVTLNQGRCMAKCIGWFFAPPLGSH